MIYSHNVNKDGLIGKIEIELLPWQERVSRTKDIVYKQEGDLLVDRNHVEQGEKTLKLVEDRVRNVSLKFEETEIKSFEELMMYREGMAVANEIGSILTNGVQLGKK